MTRPAFPNARRRAQCPECGRSISLQSVTTLPGGVEGPLRAHRFVSVHCPGSGTWVAATRRTEMAA